ncbi:hypothetical protein B0H63DRAFT_456114 [Podospora didyma]|uniref:Integrase catalytic domain-containing protein n=1 Tax=Podospora didyma TaxID=330526 RepID=A0AAE0JY08_9PEZI|nr:hypothetical protein B0H63DRAFT_456114 [Podospora didyma]
MESSQGQDATDIHSLRKDLPVSMVIAGFTGVSWYIGAGVRVRGILSNRLDLRAPNTAQCSACAQAKIKRQVSRELGTRPTEPGERLAIDFHDFHPDHEKFNSLMLITDRYSGWMWDYYLQSRESKGVADTLRDLLKFLEV